MTKPDDSVGEKSVAETKLEGVEFILRENERLKKRLRGFEGRAAAQKSVSSPEKPAEVETKPAQAEPEQPQPKHFVHASDRYCPDCGDLNPLFSDETECKGCKRPLGAIKEAARMKSCPDCGSNEFRPKRTMTKEEELLFAK